MDKQIPLLQSTGWALLNQGDFVAAAAAFDQEDLSIKALGYARIATRLGQLKTAQEWLNLGLTLCHKQTDHQSLSYYQGALGELLIRALQPRRAFLHMQISSNLRPKGHPDRQRQYSFLGIPLARLGKFTIAENYFMRAFVLAKQNNDEFSMSHALARRAMLSVHTGDMNYWYQSKRQLQNLRTPDALAMAIVNLVALIVKDDVMSDDQGIVGSIEWCLHQRFRGASIPSPIMLAKPEQPNRVNWLPDVAIEDIDLLKQDTAALHLHLFA